MLKKVYGVVGKIVDESTVMILVDKTYIHKLYKKIIKIKKKYMVHKDKSYVLNVGDVIVAKECPPISKRKRLILVSEKV